MKSQITRNLKHQSLNNTLLGKLNGLIIKLIHKAQPS